MELCNFTSDTNNVYVNGLFPCSETFTIIDNFLQGYGVYIFFATMMMLSLPYLYFLLPETKNVPLYVFLLCETPGPFIMCSSPARKWTDCLPPASSRGKQIKSWWPIFAQPAALTSTHEALRWIQRKRELALSSTMNKLVDMVRRLVNYKHSWIRVDSGLFGISGGWTLYSDVQAITSSREERIYMATSSLLSMNEP